MTCDVDIYTPSLTPPPLHNDNLPRFSANTEASAILVDIYHNYDFLSCFYPPLLVLFASFCQPVLARSWRCTRFWEWKLESVLTASLLRKFTHFLHFPLKYEKRSFGLVPNLFLSGSVNRVSPKMLTYSKCKIFMTFWTFFRSIPACCSMESNSRNVLTVVRSISFKNN